MTIVAIPLPSEFHQFNSNPFFPLSLLMNMIHFSDGAHFRSRFQSLVSTKMEEVRLSCDATGENPISINWKKNNKPIIFDPKRYIYTHTLSSNIIISILLFLIIFLSLSLSISIFFFFLFSCVQLNHILLGSITFFSLPLFPFSPWSFLFSLLKSRHIESELVLLSKVFSFCLLSFRDSFHILNIYSIAFNSFSYFSIHWMI